MTMDDDDDGDNNKNNCYYYNQHLCSALSLAKYFADIVSFDPPNNPMRSVQLLASFNRRGD